MTGTSRSRRQSCRERRSLLAAWLLWSAAFSCVVQAQDGDDELSDIEDAVEDKSDSDSSAERSAPAAGSTSDTAASGGDVEQARYHFDRGVEYYNDGDHHAALIEFQRAYTLRPAYRLLYNLGQVAFELRDYAGAERYFRSYLAEGQDDVTSERRAEVQGELEQLQKRVASVRITTNQHDAEIRVDDHTIDKSAGMPVRVSAGRRRIVADKSGYAPVERVIDVLGGESLDVQLVFGPQIVPMQGQGVASQARSSSNALPWVTGIGSGLVLLAAGGFGYAAYHDSSKHADLLREYTTRQELERMESQARTKALVSDILLGTGIVGGIVTMVLVLSGDSDDTAPSSAKTKPLQLGAAGLLGHF